MSVLANFGGANDKSPRDVLWGTVFVARIESVKDASPIRP